MAAKTSAPTPKNICVVVGEDAFLRHEAEEAFRRQSKAPPPGALGAESFDFGRGGKEATDALDNLLAAARTVPMLGGRRWVHGRNLEGLPAASHPALLRYCTEPVPSCLLLLSASKLDGRLKLTQALRAQGVVVQVDPPRPRELPGWVMQRARASGVRLDGQAAAAVATRVGPNFGVLASALETLRTWAGPDQAPISPDDVDALVAPTREAHVFELTAALGRHDWPASSSLLHELLAAGESPLLVLALLTRQLRLLLAAKRWRGHARDLADAAGVRPFVAEALLQETRKFGEGQLMDAMRAAQACDVAVKTGTLAPHLALERLLIRALLQSVD